MRKYQRRFNFHREVWGDLLQSKFQFGNWKEMVGTGTRSGDVGILPPFTSGAELPPPVAVPDVRLAPVAFWPRC